MEINDIRKMQQLLKTATESINEAMAIAIHPQGEEPTKCKIYVTQQRPQDSKGDDGWNTLFADVNPDKAQKWVDSHKGEYDLFNMEYRVITISLFLT